MVEPRKIKILWLSNISPIPIENYAKVNSGGWILGAYESIKFDEKKENEQPDK